MSGNIDPGRTPSQSAGFAVASELSAQPRVVPMTDSGIVVFESRHAPGFASVLRQDFPEFLWIIQGKARVTTDQQSFLIEPNSLVHIAARTHFSYEDAPRQPVTLYSIQYREEMLPDALSRRIDSPPVQHWHLGGSRFPLVRAFRSDYQEMLFEQYGRREGWEIALHARLLDLCLRAVRLSASGAEDPAWLFEKGKNSAERVASYAVRLETQFYEHQTLDDAARSTCLSRRRFTALFREITGFSWHKYILHLRINHAKKLLRGTDKTIAAVAFECGFEDLPHFNHVFKQTIGSAPSGYRQGKSEPTISPIPTR